MMERTRSRDFAFWMTTKIHDNAWRRRLDPPERTLQMAGVGTGQQVLEIGCGTGYFTPAAGRLVGEAGHVYALDLYPPAIDRVKEKLAAQGVTNVTAMVGDAASTGLEAGSMDLVLLIGVIHRLPLDRVLPELRRVLRPDGRLYARIHSSQQGERIEASGLFVATNERGIYLVAREKGDEK